MSDDEYATLHAADNKMQRELAQIAKGFQRCGVLMQALEVAAALECADEAYSGFPGGYDLVEYAHSDLLDDVAKGCKRALNRWLARAKALDRAVTGVYEGFTTLEGARVTALSRRMDRIVAQYAVARATVLRACSPT